MYCHENTIKFCFGKFYVLTKYANNQAKQFILWEIQNFYAMFSKVVNCKMKILSTKLY